MQQLTGVQKEFGVDMTSDDPGPDWDTAQHVRENSRGSAAAVSRSPK